MGARNVADILTMQDLANGSLDVKALGEAANGDENTIVTTRAGNTYPSAERAINIMFQNGGLPATPFKTKALMTASSLANDNYAMVTDDTDNNGLYVKTAGVWVKSSYDPTVIANKYTDKAILGEALPYYENITTTLYTAIDTDGESRVRATSKNGIVTKLPITDEEEQKVKSIIAGANISLLETETSITISSGEGQGLAVPYEFVTILLAGQSNSSDYGGDALLATSVPDGVCFIWDYDNNVLRDINDSSAKSSYYKKTFIPSIALEIYLKTGKGLVAVAAGKGSTSQLPYDNEDNMHWHTSSTLRTTAVARMLSCREALMLGGYSFSNAGIVWSQGEHDSARIDTEETTAAEYEVALKEMIAYFREKLGERQSFYIVATGKRSSYTEGYKQVRAAQYKVVSTTNNTYMGYGAAFTFPERGLMADNVHYNQEGKNIIGKAVAKLIASISSGVN